MSVTETVLERPKDEPMLPFQLTQKMERPERIEKYQELVFSAKQTIGIERARLITEAYNEMPQSLTCKKRAFALEKILQKSSIFIEPYTLIVGSQTECGPGKHAPLFPEVYGSDLVKHELVDGTPSFPWNRPAGRDQWFVENSEEFIKEIKSILEFWEGIGTAADMAHSLISDKAKLTQSNKGLFVFDKEWYINYGDGHYIPDYPYLLEKGLKGNIRRCKEKIENIDYSQSDALEKKIFWESVIQSTNAVINWAHRYAKLARDMAENASDAERKKELMQIAEICEWVPENPPRTFHEALQFVYFIHVAVHIEDAGHSISIGRVDQYFYPYFKNDIERDRIRKDEALELIMNWYIKVWQLGKWKTVDDARVILGKPMHQNITIGGLLPDGTDGTNELTYLFLEAKKDTRMTEPQLTARWHKGSPWEYKMACAKLIRLGIGQPALFNDHCIIPSLMQIGYEQEEAYNYAITGCVEPTPQGLLGGCAGGPIFNISKPVELALYNGNDPVTGLNLHKNKNNKDLSTFESYDEVWEAFLDQLDFCHLMEQEVQLAGEAAFEAHLDEPLTSTVGDPITTIERGKGFKKGGSKYDFLSDNVGAVASAGNALASVKWLVFDKKLLTGSQLKHALETNFTDMATDPTGPEIRAMAVKAPKFGNDDDYVDFITRDVLAYHCREVKKFPSPRKGRGPKGCFVNPSTTSASGNACWTNMGAMPDGRRKGQAPSDAASPAQGELGPRKGLSAAINSITKYLNILVSDGQLVNYKVLPIDLSTDKGLEKFIHAAETCFDQMGFHMQFNVVSADTLRKAQKNPDKFKGLMVRVAGYSAYFTDLDKEVQEDIISRVELEV